MFKKYLSAFAFLLCISTQLNAQGPPIMADKPIMLGGNKSTIRTAFITRNQGGELYSHIPLSYVYNIKDNIQISTTIPLVFHNEMSIGDPSIRLKYQFYRKDGKAKTFRMAAKYIQSFPGSKDYGLMDISLASFQSYLGAIIGYESIRYGILGELAYIYLPNGRVDYMSSKLTFGLPLLKPVYPVKQLNLYFEYEGMIALQGKDIDLMYSQGFQYAINRWTIDIAYQRPWLQRGLSPKRKWVFYVGGRYIL